MKMRSSHDVNLADIFISSQTIKLANQGIHPDCVLSDMRYSFQFTILLLVLYCTGPAGAKEWVSIDADKPRTEKTALVIFNGFGGTKSGMKAQMAFWENKGMDVFIPQPLVRTSLDESVIAVGEFAQEYHLAEYAEVKAICYIAGAYLMHRHLEKGGLPNLSMVIYDRSPTQERAPKAVIDRFPLLGKMAMGDVLKDLSEAEWPAPPPAHVERGLIIENRATSLMRILEAEARSMGPLVYDWRAIDSAALDAFHVALDHDMMYTRWDIIGEPSVYFFENGVFPADLPRERLNANPFDKSLPIPEVR